MRVWFGLFAQKQASRFGEPLVPPQFVHRGRRYGHVPGQLWGWGLSVLGPGGFGGIHRCQTWLLPMVDPRYGGCSQALGTAFGCSARCTRWHPHRDPGLLSRAVGCTADGCGVREPRPAPSCPEPVLAPSLVQCTCTTETHALLRHCSVTNCSEACEGTGSDLKMESFPIYRHHTHADVREVWHCVRKATGTVVTLPGRMTGCPR